MAPIHVAEVLHCRETLGVRAPDLRERMRTHYAESDNELHHLLIMESLGGNAFAADRAIAQTLASPESAAGWRDTSSWLANAMS